MSVKRIRIVGWLLVALLLLPTAAAARAMFRPSAAALAGAAQSTVAVEYYQYDRGSIVDRYGRSFTDAPAPALLLFPAQLGEEDTPELARLLGISAEQLAAEVAGRHLLVLRRDLSEEQAAALAAAELPAVHLVELPRRQPQLAAWLIGSAEPLTGLELAYDEWLRGRGGGQVMANIDARGSYCGNGLFRVAGGSGNTLRLTLDLDYQQLAEQALGQNAGGLVLLNARNGDVLAWAAADAAQARDAHSAAQLQPLLRQLADTGAWPPVDESAAELTLLQAAQVAALVYQGSRLTPRLVAGVYNEQGEWLLQEPQALPEPPLITPLPAAWIEQLMAETAGPGGSWQIAQLAGEEQLVLALWLEEGAYWQARQLADQLLRRIAALENW